MTTQKILEYNARREVTSARGNKRTKAFGGLARSQKITGRTCRYPGCVRTSDVQYHHIIPRSHFHGTDPDIARSENAMPLCNQHHQDHHTTVHGRVPRHVLLEEEIAFVLNRKNQSWLDKWYPEATTL